MGELHPKYRTPHKWLFVWYLLTIVPLALDLSVNQIADLVMFITYLRSIVYAIGYLRMPKMLAGSVGKIHVPYAGLGIQTVNVFLCRRCSIPADLQCNGSRY